MNTKICTNCHEEKPTNQFRRYNKNGEYRRRARCAVCEKAIRDENKANGHKPKKQKRPDDIEYISMENAQRICGCTQGHLRRLAGKGKIRAIKVPDVYNGYTWRYHIDDVRYLGFPGTSDVAAVAGIPATTLSDKFKKFRIPAARKIGRSWRFPPRTADLVLRWIDVGYRVPFGGITRR